MSILSYTFFQNALLGSLLASILCGLIGTYIVARRLVFISGGITHASFGGIGIGVYLGFSPILSAAVFSVLSACGIQWFSHRRDMREDSAIAIFWTLGMSIGIICSFLAPGFTPELSSYLFGNILTVTPSDLYLLGTHRPCGFHMLPSSARFHGFRCRIRPFATPSGHHGGISDDGLHRTDYCSLPAYGGHRVGHFPTDHPSSNSQYFHA